MHFEPNTWYIHIGTPAQRIRMALAGFARVHGYLMMGSDIPELPQPPETVRSLLGVKGESYDANREENNLATGKGIVFGAGVDISVDQTYLMFFAKANLGAGFDIMLKKYADNLRCADSEGEIGINQWYAKGQAYAYVQGSIGIKVKIFRRKRRFKILELGVAALLQAELPNPTWMQGTVGGRFRILGGLIKGKCKFKMTVGNRCNLEERPPEDITMIADMSPKKGDQNVDVFASPQVVF